MRRTNDLPTLGQRARRRAFLLRSLVDTLQPPLSAEEKRRVAYVAIEALNLWGLFSRAFFISCAVRARDNQGARIVSAHTTIREPREAITFAVHWWKPDLTKKKGPWSPFDEPPWTTPTKLLDLMTALGTSNVAVVATAISQEPRSFKDLKTARNFFAHRSEATVDELRTVARRKRLNPALRPAELMCSRTRNRPQNVLADWIDDIREAIEVMSF